MIWLFLYLQIRKFNDYVEKSERFFSTVLTWYLLKFGLRMDVI